MVVSQSRTSRSNSNPAIIIAIAVITLLLGVSDASARKWKPSKMQQAMDYLQIEYQASDRELMIIQWLAPAMIQDNLQTRTAREMLREYLVLMAAHASFNTMGQAQTIEPAGLNIETADKKIHQPIPENDLPPALSGILHTYKKIMAGALGVVGQGMTLKVFKQVGVSDCRPGAFWVRYAGERFEYKTPVPGCE